MALYEIGEQITIPETGKVYKPGSTHELTDEEVQGLRYRFHAQIKPARQTTQGHPKAIRKAEEKKEDPKAEPKKKSSDKPVA